VGGKEQKLERIEYTSGEKNSLTCFVKVVLSFSNILSKVMKRGSV
jgi:hypothetical protein